MIFIAYNNAILRRTLQWLIARDRWKKRALVLSLDTVLCVAAVWLAFSLRLSVWPPPIDFPFLVFTLVAVALFSPIFILTGTYQHIIRFSGSRTTSQLALASALLAVPLILLFTINQAAGIPRTIAILHPILFFLLLSSSRMLARSFLADWVGRGPADGRQGVKRCLIYGAGAWGQQLQASLEHDRAFRVEGFIDDDDRLHRQRLNGTRVYHEDKLQEVIADLDIDTVFLAIQGLPRYRRKSIVERLSKMGVHVQILPTYTDLVQGTVSVSDLREVRIGDLLGRDAVPPDETLLGRVIEGKTVLVTGAGGSIGSELCRQILKSRPRRLVLAEMSEASLYRIDHELKSSQDASSGGEVIAELVNMADRDQVMRLMIRLQPDTVFHAAAYKHVPLIETNVLSGLRNNILGTLNAALGAREVKAGHFVLISSDKAVRPTNVMGASKRVCELILQALATQGGHTRFAMVRFGNVLGSSGSVVPQFEAQIRRGGPVTLTDRRVTRFFMTIPEAAQLVIQAGGMAEGGEVFLLDMGQPILIADLARTMIELSGRTVRSADNPEGDIEIREIGMRPGEKLFEELLIDSNSEPTAHPRIMRAQEAGVPAEELFKRLAALSDCLSAGDQDGAVAILRRLVPEYAPAEAAFVAADTL